MTDDDCEIQCIQCRTEKGVSPCSWIIVQHGSELSESNEVQPNDIKFSDLRDGNTGKWATGVSWNLWASSVSRLQTMWNERYRICINFPMKNRGKKASRSRMKIRICKWMGRQQKKAHKPLKIYAIAFGNWILIASREFWSWSWSLLFVDSFVCFPPPRLGLWLWHSSFRFNLIVEANECLVNLRWRRRSFCWKKCEEMAVFVVVSLLARSLEV